LQGGLESVRNFLYEQILPKLKNHHYDHEVSQGVVICVDKEPLSESSPEVFLYLGFVFHSE